jgi:glycine/D-amino acid oxidase-like deaminating enzyme
MTKRVDYILVGQGIAGTVLAWTLIEQGKSVFIIDDPAYSNASRIAAGLYNPVVFKRLVKSWMADELIPIMDDFYPRIERKLNIKCYHKKQIVKLFAEPNEKEFWLKKTKEEVGKYLSPVINEEFLADIVNVTLGSSEVEHAGNLETLLFLNASSEYFRKHDLLLEERFSYNDLKILADRVNYKNTEASKIIFCEGHKNTDNPWFGHLPFKLTKGEIITVKLSHGHVIPDNKVINKGVFILPLGNNKYKVGSTYEWNELTDETTERGREELKGKLEKILKVPFEIIAHEAGIRPTVNDRRPILGLHPQHPALGIFNGMGTKGVMLAPYFAKQLVNFLENKTPLNSEVDIQRFL